MRYKQLKESSMKVKSLKTTTNRDLGLKSDIEGQKEGIYLVKDNEIVDVDKLMKYHPTVDLYDRFRQKSDTVYFRVVTDTMSK